MSISTVFIKGIGMVRIIEENRILLKKYGKDNLLPVGKKEPIKEPNDTDNKRASKPIASNGKRTKHK